MWRSAHCCDLCKTSSEGAPDGPMNADVSAFRDLRICSNDGAGIMRSSLTLLKLLCVIRRCPAVLRTFCVLRRFMHGCDTSVIRRAHFCQTSKAQFLNEKTRQSFIQVPTSSSHPTTFADQVLHRFGCLSWGASAVLILCLSSVHCQQQVVLWCHRFVVLNTRKTEAPPHGITAVLTCPEFADSQRKVTKVHD